MSRIQVKAIRLFTFRLFALMFVVFGAISTVDAQEWTRFRGTNGDGGSDATTIPTEIDQDDFNWQIELPGIGHSSPVVWGERLFLLSASPETAEVYLLCVNTNTGESEWQRDFESQTHQLHPRSSFASGTPAVDQDHVYFAFAHPDKTTLMALTHEGETVWTRDLGTFTSQHGFGGSPMVYKDKIIFLDSQQSVQLDREQVAGESVMLALDCASGDTIWETPLTTTRVCYSVPCVYQDEDGNDQLVCHNTGNGIFAIDPESGEKLWEVNVLEMRSVASTVTAGGLVFGSCGSGGGGNYLVGVRPGSEPAEVYRITSNANYVPTPIAYDQMLFLYGDKGIVTCIDLASGEEHWQERVSAGFSGSPVRVQDRLYAIDESGELSVIAASSDFRLLSTTDLGEPSRSTPAVSNGRLYLRTYSKLYSVGGASSDSN